VGKTLIPDGLPAIDRAKILILQLLASKIFSQLELRAVFARRKGLVDGEPCCWLIFYIQFIKWHITNGHFSLLG
jgi:hypothetical protein